MRKYLFYAVLAFSFLFSGGGKAWATGSSVVGDIAPLAVPDEVINGVDIVAAAYMAAGLIAVDLNGDVAPLNAPDGVINGVDIVALAYAAAGLVTLTVSGTIPGDTASESNNGEIIITFDATKVVGLNTLRFEVEFPTYAVINACQVNDRTVSSQTVAGAIVNISWADDRPTGSSNIASCTFAATSTPDKNDFSLKDIGATDERDDEVTVTQGEGEALSLSLKD